jgi:ankyrin repeat protein
MVGNIDRVRRAVEAMGEDVNFVDADGYTPLHAAAENERVAIVEYLLKKGANRLVRDRIGNTPLDYARIKANDEIIELLREDDR